MLELTDNDLERQLLDLFASKDVEHKLIGTDMFGVVFFSVKMNIALAEHWLAKQRKNRRKNKRQVSAMLEDTINGRHVYQADLIRLDKSGIPFDGQHRFALVVALAQENPAATIDVVVAAGLSFRGYAGTDGNFVRTSKSDLESEEIKNASILAGASCLVLSYLQVQDFNVDGRSLATRLARRELIGKHPDLQLFAAEYAKVQTKPVLSKAWLAGLHFLFGLRDAHAADQFMRQAIKHLEVQEGSPANAFKLWAEKNAKNQTPNIVAYTLTEMFLKHLGSNKVLKCRTAKAMPDLGINVIGV